LKNIQVFRTLNNKYIKKNEYMEVFIPHLIYIKYIIKNTSNFKIKNEIQNQFCFIILIDLNKEKVYLKYEFIYIAINNLIIIFLYNNYKKKKKYNN